MDFLHAILFAVLQGATELFPVSSLGHAVVVPALLHWGINQNGPGFLPFLVMLHLGTAAGLLAYFSKDWVAIFHGALGRGYAAQASAARALLGKLIVATLPLIVVGVVLKKPLEHLFGAPLLACLFLIANAGMLLLSERFRGKTLRDGELDYKDALVIGLFQCLAFLPGLSRSGAAMVGALYRGIDHEGAAKFSFLIGTPAILAAGLGEVPKLIHQHELHALFGISLLAAAVAGAVAYASTDFLMRYFKGHDSWALRPFAYYCAAFGSGSFVLLLLHI
jgi:undecaprenyl-diphosphatase